MKYHALAQLKELFVRLLECKTIPDWDREFLEDIQKRARAISGNNSFELTPKQLIQLERIEEQVMAKKAAKKKPGKDELMGEDDKPAGKGHNHPPDEDGPVIVFDKSESQTLKAVVERIENMNEEIATLTADRREIYNEAKANGLDAKTIRKIVKVRELDIHERQEQEAMYDTYCHALGMI